MRLAFLWFLAVSFCYADLTWTPPVTVGNFDSHTSGDMIAINDWNQAVALWGGTLSEGLPFYLKVAARDANGDWQQKLAEHV